MEGPVLPTFTTLYLEMRRQMVPIIKSQIKWHLRKWNETLQNVHVLLIHFYQEQIILKTLDLFLQSILGGSLVKQPMEICKGMWPIENLEGGRIVVMDVWKKFSGMFGWLQDKHLFWGNNCEKCCCLKTFAYRANIWFWNLYLKY